MPEGAVPPVPEGAVVVTGASRGIGRALALELATRGLDVVATMRDPAAGESLPDEAAALGGRLRVGFLDIDHPATIDLPEDLAILVNNAGLQEGFLPLEETPREVYERIFETNVFGQLAVLQRAIPILRVRGGGTLCTVTSSAILTAAPFFASYRGSKAAMSAICDTLRVELAPFGIRVVEILPGPVDTEGLAQSDTIPAVDCEPYRLAALEMERGRPHVHAIKVSAAEAATWIADVLLGAPGPMRQACDLVGEALVEHWRTATDEEMMATMLARYSPPFGRI